MSESYEEKAKKLRDDAGRQFDLGNIEAGSAIDAAADAITTLVKERDEAAKAQSEWLARAAELEKVLGRVIGSLDASAEAGLVAEDSYGYVTDAVTAEPNGGARIAALTVERDRLKTENSDDRDLLKDLLGDVHQFLNARHCGVDTRLALKQLETSFNFIITKTGLLEP